MTGDGTVPATINPQATATADHKSPRNLGILIGDHTSAVIFGDMTVVIASYNDTVREWNSRIASVPDNLAAGLTNAEKSDYMDIDPGASPARQVSF